MNEQWIATRQYICGRYMFTAWLPRIGASNDTPQWSARIDDTELPGRYASLEEAMRAALDAAEEE